MVIDRKSIIVSSVMSVIALVLLTSAFYGSHTLLLNCLKVFFVLIFPMLSVVSPWYRRKVQKCSDCLYNLPGSIGSKREAFIKVAVYVGVSVLLAWICSTGISAFVTHRANNFILFNVCLALWLLVSVILFFRKELFEKLHVVVFCIIMIAGGCYINICSTEPLMGNDETTHYRNVVLILDAISGEGNKADEAVIDAFYNHTGDYFSEEARVENDQKYNELYEVKGVNEQVHGKYLETTRAYCYAPYIVGTVVGRALHLPYTATHDLAFYTNLAFYAAMISAAIKRIRSSKVIMACLATGGLMMFEAASCQYDPFIICTTLLAFALFLQACEEKKMTNERMFGIILLMLLGINIKPVYFPIMLPFLFAPKDIFESEKQRKTFNLLTIAAMVLLALTIFAPALTGGLGEGDTRGGPGVNATEQVKYILTHPFDYAKVFLKTTFYSLFPFQYACMYLFYYGSLGVGSLNPLALFPFIGGLLFSGENEYVTKKYKYVSWFAWFLCILLSVTALYVAFNSVGAGDVYGMQYRYMLPAIFVLFAAVPRGWKKVRKYGGLYAAVYAALMAVNLIVTTGQYYYVMF